ncbi:uncharacterized protein N7473_001660 [Penicillium subrubescens]|uniref:Uncharacterized protein n=1 Tax=Penicillium subrubescens TaxID=1316194 RepID=A0A1Q5U2U9_9EURO|nr:uncharacterized protein N7473_001660 [Penicillium subrubescens]KAJ5904744.1 hypothetical protein N7473_001660 [Penicillium subrubescens]OKP06822.1 hypothetical protein PENSUB_6189 [Penicillium subrubescens]
MDSAQSHDLIAKRVNQLPRVSLASLNRFERTPASDDPYYLPERLQGRSMQSAAVEANAELLERFICKKATKVEEGKREEINKEEGA